MDRGGQGKMSNKLRGTLGVFTLLTLLATSAQAASVSVTIEGKIDHPSNPLGSDRLAFFGVQFNDLFAINFTYDDQLAPGNTNGPVQNYSATLGATIYNFTNPSQIPANGPNHRLTNNTYSGASGAEAFQGFSNLQANFALQGLNSTTVASLAGFQASDTPLTLADALFSGSNSTLFFGGSNGTASSSISGFITSLSLQATPPLSAVPIPAALWLFITGLVAVFGLKRRT